MRDSCASIRPLLDAYLDDELSSLDHRKVERHIHACAACRSLRASMEQIDRAVRSAAKGAEPPPGYLDELPGRFLEGHDLAGVEAEWRTRSAARGSTPGRGFLQRLVGSPWARLALAGAAVALITVTAQRLGHAPTSTQRSMRTDSAPSPPDEIQRNAPAAADRSAPAAESREPMASSPNERIRRTIPEPSAPAPSALNAEGGAERHGPAPVAARSGAVTGGTREAAAPFAPIPSAGEVRAYFAALTGRATRGHAPTAALQEEPNGSEAAPKDLGAEPNVRDYAAKALGAAGLRRSEPRGEEGAVSGAPSPRDSASPSLPQRVLLDRERDASVPDSIWSAGWRGLARTQAAEALKARDASDCDRALLYYWRAAHRDGRELASGPAEFERLFQRERPIIAALEACAGE